MPQPLAGRAVVVTGAGAGLGRAYAVAVAAAGAAVVIDDIDEAGLDETASLIRAAGGKVVAVVADVSAPESAILLVDESLRAFGRIDGLVNNAGLLSPGPSVDQPAATIAQTLAVNVAGAVHCGAAAIRAMRAAGEGGSIVNVASGALQGSEGLTLYGTTKAAILGLTYGWALELEGTGIRCNAIAPLAHTAMSDLTGGDDTRKGPDPSLVAPAVVYLLSPRSRAVSGQILRFDGRRLGLMAPPQLTHVTERDGWDAAQIAAAIDAELAPGIAPVGLARSPRPQWV
ncbi:SDR family NAD(P)-dependent oxidoreductase [Agromyces sp. NPDC058484]|uniref:SDR family NAD(P)-dependent oxidoreductase n=1 Tax=Agromyces sp. NPDC058484 TaxID=3346524 RepID=UPI003668BB80